jgi:hypothetical protein
LTQEYNNTHTHTFTQEYNNTHTHTFTQEYNNTHTHAHIIHRKLEASEKTQKQALDDLRSTIKTLQDSNTKLSKTIDQTKAQLEVSRQNPVAEEEKREKEQLQIELERVSRLLDECEKARVRDRDTEIAVFGAMEASLKSLTANLKAKVR